MRQGLSLRVDGPAFPFAAIRAQGAGPGPFKETEMRRRIYYMLPDNASARRTMDDLLLLRIEERHIHFIARPGVSMDGLHAANVLQTSDVVHGAKLGGVLGAFIGCAGGAAVMWYFVAQPTYQIVTVLGMAAFGAVFGAWVASMVGSSVPNSRLRQFEPALDQGRILVMVDVPEHRVEEIRELLERIHPEAADGGLEPNIPAFP
jgi:hypothetical protein